MNSNESKQEIYKKHQKQVTLALNYDVTFHSKEIEQPGVNKQTSHVIQNDLNEIKEQAGSPIKIAKAKHVIDLSKYKIRNFRYDGIKKENVQNKNQQIRLQEMNVNQVQNVDSLISPNNKNRGERRTRIFGDRHSGQQILLTEVQNKQQALDYQPVNKKEKVVIAMESVHNIETFQKIEDYPQDSFYSKNNSQMTPVKVEPAVHDEPQEHRSIMKKSRHKIFQNSHVQHFEASSHIMSDSYVNQLYQQSKQDGHFIESKVVPYIKVSEPPPPEKQEMLEQPNTINNVKKLDQSQIISFGDIPNPKKQVQL